MSNKPLSVLDERSQAMTGTDLLLISQDTPSGWRSAKVSVADFFTEMFSDTGPAGGRIRDLEDKTNTLEDRYNMHEAGVNPTDPNYDPHGGLYLKRVTTQGAGLLGNGTAANPLRLDVAGGGFTDYVKYTDIVNNLTSTQTNRPLSAAQGKTLQDNKANNTITISAGNGLSGGGNLTASRTLGLNLPLDVTTSSTNNVGNSTTGHTHRLVIPDATGTVKGLVLLNNTLTSTATNQALTAAQGTALNEIKLNKTPVNHSTAVVLNAVQDTEIFQATQAAMSGVGKASMGWSMVTSGHKAQIAFTNDKEFYYRVSTAANYSNDWKRLLTTDDLSSMGASQSAQKLATPRTIILGGILSGNVSFDGSTNVTFSNGNINANSITTAMLQDNAVSTSKLLADAVTTVKITDAAITNAKLASGIDGSKITAGTIGVNRMAQGTTSALGSTKLFTNTGTATDGTMTQAAITTALNNISVGSSASASAGDGILATGNKLGIRAPLPVTATSTDTTGSATVGHSHSLAAGAVTNAKIADGAVNNAKIAAGVDAAKITTGVFDIGRIPVLTVAKLPAATATANGAVKLINNVTTATALQGALDAMQGKVLNDRITASWDTVNAVNLRTIKPNATPKTALSNYLVAKNGLTTTTPDGDYGDLLVLNSWGDASAGEVNALFFSKPAPSTKRITHYRAPQGATTWGTGHELAYVSDVTNAVNAIGNQYLKLTGGTLSGLLTGTVITTAQLNIGNSTRAANFQVDSLGDINLAPVYGALRYFYSYLPIRAAKYINLFSATRSIGGILRDANNSNNNTNQMGVDDKAGWFFNTPASAAADEQGLVVQAGRWRATRTWGNIDENQAGGWDLTFPFAFPNKCIAVIVSRDCINNSDKADGSVLVRNIENTKFNFNLQRFHGGAHADLGGLNWIAIGY